MTSTRFHDNGATRPPRIIPVGEELPPMEAPPASSNGRRRQQDRDRNKPKGKTTSKAKVVGERFRILNAFLDFTASRLQRNELLVWLILYRDARDGIARTSQADLARRAGVSKRTVIRAVRKLVHRGLLAVAHRGSIRLGPSAYRVLPLERDGTERRDR
jgi:predicted DNA-binding transcriptional regulator